MSSILGKEAATASPREAPRPAVPVFDVFVPNGMPRRSYVNRPHYEGERSIEEQLQVAIAQRDRVISISGPSKSGKTVLIKKVIGEENLITLNGASIGSVEELWRLILDWMDAPSAHELTQGSTRSAENTFSSTGTFQTPGASGSATLTNKVATSDSEGRKANFTRPNTLGQIVKEIGGSTYVIFIDDFHYMKSEIQSEIAKNIKAASEQGIRFCCAVVPHKSDNVVRSNPELRGRIAQIDTRPWLQAELAMIAKRGFDELNVDVKVTTINRLATEACGSPQIMQEICLQVCVNCGLTEAKPLRQEIDIPEEKIVIACRMAAASIDYKSTLDALVQGPKERGKQRSIYKFKDGSEGDVYRCILKALSLNPPKLEIEYDDLAQRVRAVCSGDDVPPMSSVTQSMSHLFKIAGTSTTARPPFEWIENDVVRPKLVFVEPHFLLALRWRH